MGANGHVLMDAAKWPVVDAARSVVSEILGEEAGFTGGQMARQLLAWLGLGGAPSPIAKASLDATQWHYFLCKPCRLSWAGYFDLRACYWNLLSRCPTLRPVWAVDDVLWMDSTPNTQERWEVLKRALSGCKPVRNALIGAMIGGSTGQIAYSKGGTVSMRSAPGPAFDLGALIVRTGYDVCELEAHHSNAVYANTDCVIIEGEDRPAVWPELDLPFELQAQGETHVCCIGKYRVGSKQTCFYDGHPFSLPFAPDRHLASEGRWRWLLDAR